MENKLFNELLKIEKAVSFDFGKKESEIIEIYVFLLYFKLLPYVNPNKHKNLLGNYCKELTGNENDECIFNTIWDVFSNANDILDVLKKFFDESVDSKRYELFIEKPDSKILAEINNWEKDEYFRKHELYEGTKKFIEESFEFIDKLELIYDIDYNKKQFILYLTDFSRRFSQHDILKNIDGELFEFVFDSASQENIFFEFENNLLNVVNFSFRRNKKILFGKKINLFTKSVFDIFNVNYKITSNLADIKLLRFYDFSFFNDEELEKRSDAELLLITQDNDAFQQNPACHVYDKEKQDYYVIKKFIRTLVEKNYLREIIYSSGKEVVLNMSSTRKNKTVELVNFDDIKTKQNRKRENINAVAPRSKINISHYLTGGVDFSSIFRSEIVAKKLREIAYFTSGEVPLNLRFSRKKKVKEIITDADGEFIITPDDLLLDGKDLLQTFTLKKTKIPKKYSDYFLKSDVILFSIIKSSFYVKIFKKRHRLEKVYLSKNVNAIIILDEKFSLDIVFLQIKKVISQLQKNVNKGNNKQEIIDILNDFEIITYRDKLKSEIKEKATKIFSDEKKLLTEFRHMTKERINAILQNLKKLRDFLDKRNLLKEKIFDFPGQPELATTLRESIDNVLNEIKLIHHYQRNLKELLGEIDYENFQVLDLCEELKKINFEKFKENNIYINLKECKSNIYKIWGHKDYFREIIEQLINNAREHAFDEKQENKSISFTLSIKNDTVEMIYENNGKPFEISKDEFIEMGKTTSKDGTGYGGAMINKYVKSFNGDFEIISKKPTIFRFIFPL